MTRVTMALGGLALMTLAACGGKDQESGEAGNIPSLAEQSCMIAVANSTGNPEVSLLGSEFSEIGTTVQVGVGANQAPWQCISYNDGRTGGITSLTNEGAL